MLKKIKIISITLALFLGISTSVFAGVNDGDIEGFYVPTRGWAESKELYPGENIGEQLGKFKFVLKRQGWGSLSNAEKDRIRKRLVIKGVFHGVVENPTTAPIIDHQLSNKDRDGALFTQNDSVSVLGFQPCSAVAGVLTIQETLNFQNGIGIYQSLQPGGTVSLHGTINACTTQNDFVVISGQGGLCLGSASCN